MPVLKHRETGAVREFGEREAKTYRKRGWEDVEAAAASDPSPRRRPVLDEVAPPASPPHPDLEPTPEG